MPVLGIPDRTKSTDPRTTKFEIWEGSIQEHSADRAGDHYDIRIGDPQTGIAHSWAVRSIPGPGDKVLAIKQPDHTMGYMDYAGEISSGYGKGKVKKVFRDKIELLKSEPGKISFNLYQGKNTVRLNLIKVGFGWLLVNSTLTTESRQDVPLNKPSYKSISLTGLDLINPNEVFAPKIDGAHNIISLRKDKPIEVTSYRPAKTKAGLIDHSFRTDLYKVIPPPSLNNTLIRAELFGVDDSGKTVKSTDTAGLLNSEVWKTRSSGKTLNNVIFDVIKFKGKSVANAPYKEKLQMLNEISKEIPQLKLPPLAATPEEKKKMVDEISEGKNPLTQEGIVVYNLNASVPLRGKIRQDIDVYVKDTFPGKGRLKNKMVGGFMAARDLKAAPLIRVGSGLSDKLRRNMYLHPDMYKNRLAKIYVQENYPSGKARVPIFKEWRDML